MKRTLLMFFIISALGQGLWSSQGSERGKTPTTRYVLLIDTTRSMAGHKPAIAEFIRDRVRAGLEGEVRPGELFSIWTFGGAEVATNAYLPVTWVPRQKELIATRLARAFEDQVFDGEQAHWAEALRDLFHVMAASDTLKAVILSRGDLMAGTPFDANINAAYRELRSGSASHRLLTTMLLAKQGQIIGWTVELLNSAGEAPITATRPQPTVPAGPQSAAEVIPALASKPVTATESPLHMKAEIANRVGPTNGVTPVAITSEVKPSEPTGPTPAAPPDAPTVSETTKPADEGPIPLPAQVQIAEAPAKPVETPATETAPLITTVSLTPANPEQVSPKSPDALAQPSAPARPKAPAVVPASALIQTPPAVASKAPPVTIEPPMRQQTAASETTARLKTAPMAEITPAPSGRLFLVVGVVFLLIAGGGLYAFARQRKAEEPSSSLISRSIAARKENQSTRNQHVLR